MATLRSLSGRLEILKMHREVSELEMWNLIKDAFQKTTGIILDEMQEARAFDFWKNDLFNDLQEHFASIDPSHSDMHVVRNDGQYHFYNSLEIKDRLEPKNYSFNYEEKHMTCWLEDLNDFITPEKIYDVDKTLREYIVTSQKSQESNLGVLLTGNKGQGKSLTAKLLCKEIDLPIIIINKPIPNTIDFVRFLNGIKQDFCLFVDEFEKIFHIKSTNNPSDYHTQDVFLSFMDGVLTNKHKVLFLLTTNDSVHDFFINRPSRIKFLQEYNELSQELFDMIVDDKLVNKAYKKDLEDSVSLINMNIDLLISIVNDINRYDKPFSEFKKFYNYKEQSYNYDLEITKEDGKKFGKIVHLKDKIRTTTKNIDDYEVIEMVKFTPDEIIFKSKFYEDSPVDSGYKSATIKATPFKKGLSILI